MREGKNKKVVEEEYVPDRIEKLETAIVRIFRWLKESPDETLRSDIILTLQEFSDLSRVAVELSKNYVPRRLPFDYLERARYVLQNFKRDRDRYKACVEYNKQNKRTDGEFRYLGLSKQDFEEICKDAAQLSVLFNTTLQKYKQLFLDLFYAGRSLQEYADEFLPDKKKKTAENMANRLYADLAAEYKRLASAGEVKTDFPIEELRKILFKDMDAFFYNLNLLLDDEGWI